jgi:hypothetical protein
MAANIFINAILFYICLKIAPLEKAPDTIGFNVAQRGI